jgi:hypothetical protein
VKLERVNRRWTDWRWRTRIAGSYFLVSSGAMLLGFPFMLLTLSADFGLIWVWLFAMVFGLLVNTGPTNTILANGTPPPLRAAAFAVNIIIIHAFGDVLSPVVIGLVSDRTSMKTSFAGVSAMFLAGVCWLVGARFLQRDTERASGRLTAG